MESPHSLRAALIAISLLLTLPAALRGQNSSLGSFTYQGRLNDTSGPANGLFDFQFSLYPASSGTNNQVDTTITRQFLPVTNGLFAVTLSFPMANSSFNGSDRWLEIAVKPGGVPTNYTILSPRQQITSAPYAIKAGAANLATTAYSVPGVRVNTNTFSTALGLNTTASGNFSTAMGNSSIASGTSATAMGTLSTASGGASVAAGSETTASGTFSVALGYQTTAGGAASMALGTQAKAPFNGSFVWADHQFTDFVSTSPNQFLIRASGGMGINNNNPNGAALAVGGAVNVEGVVSANAVSAGSVTTSQVVTPEVSAPGTQPLEFKVNGSRVLRLVPDLTSPNLLAGSPANATVGGIRGATVLGGGNPSYPNRAAADYATVVGGISNTASGNASVAMGQFSTASGYASVASGYGTTAGGFSSFAAGQSARAAHDGSFVWGDNTFADFASTANNQFLVRAAGGVGINNNNPNGAALAVKGNVTADGKMIVIGSFRGGYFANTISNGVVNGFIGGGGEFFYPNLVGNDYASVLGGFGNTASGYGSTAMGRETTASGDYSTAMGLSTTASGYNSTAMGDHTIASGIFSTAMGSYTTASGRFSTAMGLDTTASGAFSTAIGYLAKATHQGSFVWADNTFDQFASTRDDQFSIRASGGLRLSDSTSMEFGATPRQMLNLWGTQYGIGVQASSLYFRCNNADANDGFIWYKGGAHDDGYAQPGGGTELMHLVQGGLYVNGALVPSSDRNKKENFKPVDARAVLDKVAALPLSEWNYKQDPATRHVGPMAQDFHAAFGVGPDDKHIATVDADGVALAAIQGLNQKVEEKESRIQTLEKELAALKEIVTRLSNRRE